MKVSFKQMAGQILPAIEPVLRRQQITESEPGTVVGDFENFLDFIASGNVFASGKHDLLPMDALAALNARMARPLVIRLKRTSYSDRAAKPGRIPADGSSSMRTAS
jgi:hypothetical protein